MLNWPFAMHLERSDCSSKISRFRSLDIDSKLRAEFLDKELFKKVYKETISRVNILFQFAKLIDVFINRARSLCYIKKLFLPHGFLFRNNKTSFKKVFETGVWVMVITKSSG